MSLQEIASEKSEIFEENERECFGNKYGFIEVKNPYYMQDYSSDSGEHDCSREYLLRKPTPSERREIVINTIIQSKGRAFSIVKLASLLAVSDRTIQTLLRNLQKEGLIEITPRYNKNGARKSNSYRYIGEPCERYGTGLTLKMLYDTEEGCGFRNWAWSDKMFPHNGKFYDMYNRCKVESVTIPATEHILTAHEQVAATCTEDGYEAYWQCAECGKYCSDESGNNEIATITVIKAAGHSESEWITDTEATCTTDGAKHKECTVCQATV